MCKQSFNSANILQIYSWDSSAELNHCFDILHPGLNEIQELTKQSLRNKPFCLAVGKEWEEKQRKMNLRDIHTKLSWNRKHRKARGFKQTELDDITQILNEEQLGEDGPVRILVQGMSSQHF